METAALPIELLACVWSTILARFLMRSVLATPPAIFLHFQSLGVVALVLLYGVVATLALGARESN